MSINNFSIGDKIIVKLTNKIGYVIKVYDDICAIGDKELTLVGWYHPSNLELVINNRTLLEDILHD